ncbi:Protein of unknown function [Bacillus cytotoxicus]|uniref:Uncharacterized protein n=1 Tax=Bacillus cytotoxicus TaxID=580165 RepID=A0AAX2CHR6_9BACI|nr:Protein of unknown function [Bacillus cytotoxicus]SCN35840.1 Protein of unknown function [Bacillus cytotoxicus]
MDTYSHVVLGLQEAAVD